MNAQLRVAPTQRHRSRWVLVAILGFLLGGLTVAILYHFDVFGGGSSSSSTTEGSGVPATQARDVAAFHSVELKGSNNVVIRVGEKQSVVVKADDNLLDRVTTEVQSGTLVIANTPGSFETKSPMSVEVEVPTLTALTLSGSGNIVVDDIDAESLEVTLPGSGMLTGSGTATRLDVTVGGTGTVQFTRLVADDVRAVVGGSGSIFVTATNALDASVSGSGAILYAGNPQDVKQSVTGSGAITGS
jgi:Putative auto-transporter adhesin, head GIN domain